MKRYTTLGVFIVSAFLGFIFLSSNFIETYTMKDFENFRVEKKS